jgi:hypothetical protein
MKVKILACLAVAVGVSLVLGAAALGGTSIVRLATRTLSIPAGQTRTLTVAYPDALEYGNARYSGQVALLGPPHGTKGRKPDLGKVRILERQSVEGGSAFQVRADNANAPGSAAVRLVVSAKTVEPLPHH